MLVNLVLIFLMTREKYNAVG